MRRPSTATAWPSLLAPAMALALCAVDASAADKPDKSPVLTEYLNATPELEQFYSEAVGDATLSREIRIGSPDASREDFIIKFWLNGGRMRVDKTWELPSAGKASGATAAYVRDTSQPSLQRSLRLERKTSNDPYVLKYIGSSTEDCDYNIYDHVGRFLTSPYSIDGEPLSRLLKEPTFKVLDVRRLGGGEAALVKVEFDFRPKFPRPQTLGGGISEAFERLEGWFTLLPTDRWCLQDAEIRLTRGRGKGSFLRTTHVEYGDKQGGFPLIRKVVLEWKELKPLRHTLQLSGMMHAAPPPERFKAAEFGFPELDEAGSDNGAYIVIFMSGLLLVLAVFLLSWRNRARRGSGADVTS